MYAICRQFEQWRLRRPVAQPLVERRFVHFRTSLRILPKRFDLIDWFIHWLIAWLIDWLIDRLIDWLIDWLIDRLIDWLIDRLIFQRGSWSMLLYIHTCSVWVISARLDPHFQRTLSHIAKQLPRTKEVHLNNIGKFDQENDCLLVVVKPITEFNLKLKKRWQ
jgi:hypothetical protein